MWKHTFVSDTGRKAAHRHGLHWGCVFFLLRSLCLKCLGCFAAVDTSLLWLWDITQWIHVIQQGQSCVCMWKRKEHILRHPLWDRCCCRISPPRFMAECCKKRLNHVSLVLLCCALFAFYPRDAMLARVIVIATCPSVCPSVRPSRTGIVSKRRKLAAWFLHHLVAPRL